MRTGTFGFWMVVVLLGNVLDALFTSSFLSLRVAEEMNPLMRAAWVSSPLSFFAAKLTMVPLAVALLWRCENRVAAGIALRAGAVVYAAVILWHLHIASQAPQIVAML